jgi:hypothetical protein
VINLYKCQDLIDFKVLSYEDENYIREVLSIYNFMKQQTLAGIEYIKSDGDLELLELCEKNRKVPGKNIDKMFFNSLLFKYSLK